MIPGLIPLTVHQHVEAATQLRLVNGLVIIEDRHPLEVSSSSSSITSSSRSSQDIAAIAANRDGIWETRDNDLHGHGYLNRNRLRASSRSSRRLLKDAQGSTTTTTTTTTTVRNSFIDGIVKEDLPATISVNDNAIDDSTGEN